MNGSQSSSYIPVSSKLRQSSAYLNILQIANIYPLCHNATQVHNL